MNPSLECELTRVQMKRYLGGEELPEPLMEELEQHVHACPSCRHYLDTQKLKLAAKLSGAKAEKIKAPQEPKGPKDSDVFHEPKQKLFTPKTLGLAAALALVLFAMSAVAKDPTLIFGRKASAAMASSEKDQPVEDEDHDENHEEAEETSTTSKKKVGEIMTGETVRQELKEKEEADLAKDEAHSAPQKTADPGHESHPEPEAKKPDPAEHHVTKTAPEPKPEAKHEEKKAPDLSLVIAENGKTKKEPAPRPRPQAATPKRAPAVTRKSSPRKVSPKRSSSPKPAPAKGSGSIKVYDSQGRPIN